MDYSHIPVLAKEVVEGLDPRPGKVFIDGTLGGAGHTRLLLEKGAQVYGIDQDPFVTSRTPELPGLTVLKGNYRDMVDLMQDTGVSQVDGILLDIGVSSFQLDDASRGFSYHEEAPLDMRMSQDGLSAFEVINEYDLEDIAAILYEYAEERHSRRIARYIVEARQKKPIETTTELAAIIKRAYPGQHARGIHPARRSFQALRIHVNDELGALKDGLQAAKTLIKPGGRLAVISFHSLEDRIVKQFVKGNNGFKPLTKRPLEATEEELEHNPRSRSAKLRVAERTEEDGQ
ncbi:16S rRNA (cytosine(1402)-N(4))-methyltransferase RsmH [Deinococcus cellulosilyticus]|uniref:Ribosomal RNA small subunit methyltransferase H n=1 Tax=Deinococcus cellulosilyticus (strain DSM 18568 / NBRC 106333 / KACC 11606 / 5516J-15) TaxID=1223518 RepID=A0A511N5V1_DEIC1|nr:16S rRNA (cytosine(1402)-N(4))-methyltransferase RsmH [Deinococcus cellulosilyticus]GEM48214.1 ribosomal RNA small subunit methyltransferase H [Deinococcus cellulosilyticus NBRC 106333 = KACC 11606]